MYQRGRELIGRASNAIKEFSYRLLPKHTTMWEQKRILQRVSALLNEAGVPHSPIKNGLRITPTPLQRDIVVQLSGSLSALLGNRHYRHFLVESHEAHGYHDLVLKPRSWDKLMKELGRLPSKDKK